MSKYMFLTLTFGPFSLNNSFISQHIHVSVIGNWKQHPSPSVYAKKNWKKNVKWNFFSHLLNFAKSWLTQKTG